MIDPFTVTGPTHIPLPDGRASADEALAAKIAKQDGSEADFPELAGMVSGRLGIRDAPPLIFHPEEIRAPEFQTTLEQVLSAYRETSAEDGQALLNRSRIVDAAIKVVDVGGVGRRYWIAC